MVLSLEPAIRSVKPSLRPTKPLDTMVLLPTIFHGSEMARAEAVELGSEATSMVRLLAVSVRELSGPSPASPPH